MSPSVSSVAETVSIEEASSMRFRGTTFMSVVIAARTDRPTAELLRSACRNSRTFMGVSSYAV